jgi:hypothetical protein
MLHVVNGEATAVPIAGERLFWFDFFMEGPLGVSWAQRAAHLQSHFGVARQDYLRRKDQALAALATFREHEEVVLWFEGDLFCLTNMAFVLDWFAAQRPYEVRLCAVCPADERLGPASEARLRELFEARLVVRSDALDLAHRIWQWLLGGPEPADFAAWPLLERLVQLRRRQQAGEIQQTIKSLLSGQRRKLGPVFRDFYGTEIGRDMGMGDLQFAAYVVGMRPEVVIVPAVSGPPFKACGSWELALPA